MVRPSGEWAIPCSSLSLALDSPFPFDQNIVSILSRQWEDRVAEQKQHHHRQVGVNETYKSCSKNTATPAETNRRVAPFNPRHRRSRSVGSDGTRWLEHQETNPTPLGTVFSPKLKRRKSVTQVELKDTLKASNYLLHHQEATADGGLETKLYKGSIIPTAGGGSAVIFNDVEELRQTSPLSAKRSPSTPPNMDMRDQVTSSRRSKRRRTASINRQTSLSSTHTEQSVNSVDTAVSSNYRAISPLSHAPILANHLDSDYIRDRCQVGLDNTGGMGARTSAGRSALRKRSRR